MSPRDSQRSKVYKAGHQVDPGQRFETVSEIQCWVDKITTSKWWAKNFPNASTRVTIKDGRGRRNACAETIWHYPRLKLPRWARSQRVVLHELAHVASDDGDLSPSHGRKFCRAFLALVGRWMGSESQKELRESFRRHNVKWHRRKNLTEDQRKALAQRFRQNVLQ